MKPINTYPQLFLIALVVILAKCGSSEESSSVVNNGEQILQQASCSDDIETTCPGSTWPDFELSDYQPNSPYVGTSYGLNKFEGKVTLVALLASY